jgi:hypothetical protein
MITSGDPNVDFSIVIGKGIDRRPWSKAKVYPPARKADNSRKEFTAMRMY